MCGIVGYISKYPETYKPHREGFLRDALIMDSLRGMHSTGVMSIHNDFRIDWLKQSVDGMRFVTGKDFLEHDSNGWCAIGHNRHATMGGLDTDSAHPFDEGDVTLVHNGTLRSLTHMDGYDPKIQVDSQQIARTMSLASPEDAPKVIEQLHGAFALVWFDMRDRSINVVRNTERPLHIGVGSSDNILYMMSEGHMLYALGARFKNAPRISHVYQVRSNQLMKFHKGTLVPEVKEVKPYVPKTTRGQYSGGYWDQWQDKVKANGSKDKQGSQKNGNEKSNKNSGTAIIRATEKSPTCIKSEALERGKLYPSSDWPLTGISPMRRPGAAQAQMLSEWYWFLPNERTVFHPKRFISWGRNVGMVTGKVYHPEWDCDIEAVVYNITQHEWNSYGDRIHWVTTPVGINHSDLDFEVNEKNNGVPQPVTFVMLKVVTFEPMPSRYLPERLKKSHDVTYEADTEVDDTESDWVAGPRGPIHPDKFLELVRHGCANCSCDLDLDDDDEIVWMTDQVPDVPICWSCAEELTEEANE